MDESWIFVVTYRHQESVLDSPQLTLNHAIEFICEIGGERVIKVTHDGKDIASKLLLTMLREARVFRNRALEETAG